MKGILVEALRKGHWIVLDELNLAPSDVLESLNRLLDDNRELLIPETQEIVRPHPSFMLFATQNPPGLYGGRKQLSRAFRSRFIELHFDDIPEPELSTILERRCRLPPSYSAKIVACYKGLQNARQRSRIFEGKNAFATLRDLFRWGNRPANSIQELAENGFMVIAEKSRRDDEKEVVRNVIEHTFKLKIDPDTVYHREWSLFMEKTDVKNEFVQQIVWTNAMKRLFILVLKCIINTEPILLVGETGCGKTTVCQILTTLMGVNLQIVNAHAGSETSDFIGSMRPVRGRDRILSDALTAISSLWEEIAEVTSLESDKNFGANINIQFAECHSNLQILIDLIKSRLSQILNQPDSWPSKIAEIEKLNIESKRMFEWSDGPLVNAMRKGEAFLLDEISLADDSVLERLNSVLESERLLVLAERGAVNIEGKDSLDPNYSHIEEIRGHTNFSFMATMNPGGDYGKKELSPALRNRFTELWVPSIGDKKDLTMIINQRLESLKADSILAESISILLLDFLDWFAGKLGMVRTSIVSLRDIMAWVSFVTTMVKQNNDSGMSNLLLLCKSIFHGGCMVLLDGIGVNPLFGSMLGSAVASGFRKECSKKLAEDIFQQFMSETDVSKENFLIQIGFYLDKINIIRENNVFGIPPFLVECGPAAKSDDRFALQAPTTSINALRVLRALRLSKPVLLEGSPGVGKSSLISSLAITCGYPLCRINLSEQTDLMDLFGSDLPVEGGKGGEFAWRDGPFLSAMKNGQWILLDELNLATQQVLEGLNACLDHRATVYIPELNRSFECHKNFRVFAAQNPQNQGGGRKGLPKSFVNRFTQVYIEGLTGDDMAFIIKNLNPEIDPTVIKKMIDFNQAMHQETMVRHSFGIRGSPWEFNLRDILRWIELLRSNTDVSSPQMFLNMIYCHRMRTEADETAVIELFNTHFTPEIVPKCSLYVSPNSVSVGSSILPRSGKRHPHSRGYVTGDKLGVLTSQLPILESLIKCVEMSWMAILCGPTSSGKTSIVRFLAKLAGQQLDEFSMNSGIDAVELLGGFEQVDLNRREQTIIRFIEHTLDVTFRYIGSANFIMEDSDAIKTVFLLQSRLRSLKKFDSLLDIDAVNSLLKVLSQMIKIFGESLHAYISNAGAKKPEDISEMCEQLLYLRTSGVHGQFEWIDGTLIKALEEGRWILIDNANMCPASVLDRLNHLLEPNGVLIVNERGLVNGQVKIIHPHKNFRMFMTMDPQQGEISRAMRNRGVELFIRPPTQDFERQAADAYDIINLLNGYGLPGAILPSMLKSLHHHVSSLFHKLHIPFEDSTAIMIRFVKLAIERLERGFPWFHSVKQTFSDVYLDLTTLDALPEEISGQLREYLVIFATSNRNSNLVEIAAGSWPIRVSGKFSVEESLLAEASLEASLLLSFSFVTIDTNLFGYNTLASDQRDLLLPIPNSLQLLQAAFFRFVEESEGVFSFFAKGQLLRHISKRFIKNSSIAKLFELANNLQSFAQKIKRNLPSAKFGILLRLQEFSLLKSQIVLSNPNSIIGISESFFNHRTSEHNLPHKECLFAIVSTSSAIDYSDILQILCATEYFLRLIDTESLNPTDLTLAFQSALQAIKKSATISKELSHPCHNATINLRDAIEGCYSSLDIRAFECLSALWRNSSFTTLRDKQLIDIELEFTNISERLRLRKKITGIVQLDS
ncbi:AAA ATPase midasin [Physocladia obscura]|uniref:Midasin n=1 Tax=Physocladia obscura TaxID=109957 RepID=A0AAD5T7J0_9FUNG|nr:AAA ATPase midasin [Physocladia obscura]